MLCDGYIYPNFKQDDTLSVHKQEKKLCDG